MRNWRTRPCNTGESYYDLIEDWSLIESSFLKQYGIRLRAEEDMLYPEFCSLLSGIMPDTPLGQVVSIRAEKDKKIIKSFNKEQKRIRNEWINRKRNRRMSDKNAYADYWKDMQTALKTAYLNN